MATTIVKEVKIKKNDLQPYYYATVKDSNDTGVNLTGATIYCTMKNTSTGMVEINRQTTGIVIANQTTNPGEFEYHWQAADTDTVGTYQIEFEINPASGGKFTVPAVPTYATVKIYESLDAT